VSAMAQRAEASRAAPADSPVASIYITPDGQREFDDWRAELPVGRTELYTRPKRGQWVGLTHTERQEIVRTFCLDVGDWQQNGMRVASAVEAKLREKNGGLK